VVKAGDNSKKIDASLMSNSGEIANGILLRVGSKRLLETSANTNLNLGARIPLIEVKL
jgi:hypothetical protein